MIASTGGKGWDLLYQIESHGPNLDEIPFDTMALEATGVSPMSLHIDSVTVDHVATSIGTCTPSCAENIATPVEWYLDHSGPSILRPVPPPPPPPVVDPPSCDTYSFNDQYPIRRCDEGHAVLNIQYLLVSSGYTVDADGYFGPGTEQAVRDFQRTKASKSTASSDHTPGRRWPDSSPDGTSTATASSTPTKSSGTSAPTAVEASSRQLHLLPCP